jgi:hypothetical protein
VVGGGVSSVLFGSTASGTTASPDGMVASATLGSTDTRVVTPDVSSLGEVDPVCGVNVDSDLPGLLGGSATTLVGSASDDDAEAVPLAEPVVAPVGRPLRPSPTGEEGFAPPPATPGPIVTPPGTGTPEVSVAAGSFVGPLLLPAEPESGAASASEAPVPATSSPDAMRHAAAAMRTCGATSSPPLTASSVSLVDVLRLSHKPVHLFAGGLNVLVRQGAKPTSRLPGDSVDDTSAAIIAGSRRN